MKMVIWVKYRVCLRSILQPSYYTYFQKGKYIFQKHDVSYRGAVSFILNIAKTVRKVLNEGGNVTDSGNRR
jgi:hypothetical protein